MGGDSSFHAGTMSGLTGRGDKLNPERLKYITENFNALQGLSLVAVGALVTCARIVTVFDNPWLFFLGAIVSFALIIAFFNRIPKYYARRFGFVQRRPVAWPFSSRQVAFYIVILMVFGLILMEMDHAIRPHIDLLTFVTMMVMSFAAVGSARGLQRSTGLIAAVVVLSIGLAVNAILPLWVAFDSRQLMVWKLINAASLGIISALVGLWDHIALTRLLPGRTTEGDDE